MYVYDENKWNINLVNYKKWYIIDVNVIESISIDDHDNNNWFTN